VPSTPDDPSRGIAKGVDESMGRVGAGLADVGYFGHGTTVATNALIQLRGVCTGLITTDGFRDLVYDRGRLLPGHRIVGPAIVEQMDTTTVILPGMADRVEPYSNLILEAG